MRRRVYDMKRLAIVAVTLCLMATAGCGDKAATTAPSGSPAGVIQSAPAQSDAAAAATCATNREQLGAQYSIAQSGASPGADTSFAGVVQSTGIVCPSGGSFSWDATANKVTCSIHGQ